MSIPNYGLGSSASTIQSVEVLGLPVPQASAVDYADYVTVGNNSERGVGDLKCVWRYAVLRLAELTILQGKAGVIYVRTLKEDGTYGVYSSLMVLPPKRPPKVDYMLDYAVEFRNMVAVT